MPFSDRRSHPDGESFEALDGDARVLGGQDAVSVDGFFQVDTRMPSLGLLASRASGLAAQVPQSVLSLISSAFDAVGEAIGRDQAAVAKVGSADRAAVDARTERDLFEAAGDEVPRASRLRKRLWTNAVVVAAAVLIAWVDAQLLQSNLTSLGMSGWENTAIAYGLAATIAVASLMAAVVGAECWARRERGRAIAVFAGTNLALLLLIGVFAYVRAQNLATDAAPPATKGTGFAETAGQGAAEASQLTQVRPDVLWLMFAALMAGTLVLALIKFAMTRPRDQWTRDAEAAAQQAADTARDCRQEAARTHAAVHAARATLQLLPGQVLGVAHATRERANTVSWHYLSGLSRAVPVDVAPRVRALPEPDHALPEWTDDLVREVRAAVQAQTTAIDTYLANRPEPALTAPAGPAGAPPSRVDVRTDA